MSTRETPSGSALEVEMEANGNPDAMTMNFSGMILGPESAAAFEVIAFSLVNSGLLYTVRVNFCVRLLTEFFAVKVNTYTPPALGDGVPVSLAVPFPWSLKKTPVGSDGDSVTVIRPAPAVVTRKSIFSPVSTVFDGRLVIDTCVVEQACSEVAPVTPARVACPTGQGVGCFAPTVLT